MKRHIQILTLTVCSSMFAMHAAQKSQLDSNLLIDPSENLFKLFITNMAQQTVYCAITTSPKSAQALQVATINGPGQGKRIILHKAKGLARINKTTYILASLDPDFIKNDNTIDTSKQFFSQRLPQYLSTNCAGTLLIAIQPQGKKLSFEIYDGHVQCESFSSTRKKLNAFKASAQRRMSSTPDQPPAYGAMQEPETGEATSFAPPPAYTPSLNTPPDYRKETRWEKMKSKVMPDQPSRSRVFPVAAEEESPPKYSEF